MAKENFGRLGFKDSAVNTSVNLDDVKNTQQSAS